MNSAGMIQDALYIAVLGTLFRLSPPRFAELRKKQKGLDMLEAQILTCTAGAMIVVVIGMACGIERPRPATFGTLFLIALMLSLSLIAKKSEEEKEPADA